MKIKKLQWAGALLESETGNVRVVIDPVYNSPNFSFFGEPKEPFTPLQDLGDVQVVLITHLHSDHFDPELIIKNWGPDVRVLVPLGAEKEATEKGLLNVKGMTVDDAYEVEDVTIYSSYAVDGLGDLQVSWIIKDGEKTVLHSGDTLWHGYWWKMAKKFSPFSAVLLPVNGAIVQEEGDTPSYQPICLVPEQAVSAAKVLVANLLIPIHYGSFHNEPIYLETENVEPRLQEASNQHGVNIKILKDNEEVVI